MVSPGWVSQQEFLAGYGLAQAMPGPLFTFSAYLGAIQEPSPTGVPGAALAVGAIFLPSFLLLGGVLPCGRPSGGMQLCRQPWRESAPPSSAFSPLRSGILL